MLCCLTKVDVNDTKVSVNYICFLFFYHIELYINKILRSCTFISYIISGFHSDHIYKGWDKIHRKLFDPKITYTSHILPPKDQILEEFSHLNQHFLRKHLVKLMFSQFRRIYNTGNSRKFKESKNYHVCSVHFTAPVPKPPCF